jgi:hypothetical protein
MRSLIIRLFILLGLFFPALASAATNTISGYAGSYSGTFSGGDSGTWSVTISSTGAITGTGVSGLDGLFLISGQVSPNDSLTMGTGGSATFIGALNPATSVMSGTWSVNNFGTSGTWTGTRAQISNARVFAYAEANYPTIFAGTPVSGQYLQYNYRYYPATGNYLAVDTNGEIFILGPVSGNVVTSVGLVTAYAGYITSWEATQAH